MDARNGYAEKQARRRPLTRRSTKLALDSETVNLRREIALEVLLEICQDIQDSKEEVNRSIVSLLREVAYKLERGE